MQGGFIVIPDAAGAPSWLGARTARSLLAAESPLPSRTVRENEWISQAAAGEFRDGLIVISAGAWFPVPGFAAVPVPSATGRPVIAFGLNPRTDSPWRALCRRAGGDLSGRAPALSSLGRPPVLALDARSCAALRSGKRWEELLAEARVVHLSPLDVLEDNGLRLCQGITSLQYGGAERLALDLHRELRATGTAARLLVLGRPGRSAFPLPPEGVDLSDMPRDPFSRAAAVAAAAGRFGADLLHAHLLNAVEIKALRPHGIPLVLTLHNTSSGWPADLLSLAENDAALLAACSLGVEAEARRLLPALPVRTAWNGIDPRHFQQSPERAAKAAAFREATGLSAKDLLLVTLANPRPQKRPDRLPPVIAALQKECPGRRIRLLLAGEAAAFSDEAADCMEALKQAAADCGVEENLIFHGPADDVPALLAAADVLVSTAAHEGLSLAHLEALAMGVPVVALEAGGTGEVARAAGAAFTMLPQSAGPEAFARAVLAAADARISGREAVRRCFSLEVMTQRYRQLYRCALTAPRQPGKTLWLITNNFTTGGAQSSARRLLTEWHRRGIPVRVAVLQEEPDDATPGRLALEKAGIPVLVLPRIGPHEAAETLEPLWPELADDPPQAVLFWNAVTSCKRLIADGLPRTPIFDISPGGMFFEALHPAFDRLRPDIPALTPADYGARLSGAVVKYAREKSQAETALEIPVHVIPNGVELPENPVPFRGNPPCFVFGTAARLHPRKRLEDLLEAFRLALPGLPPCGLQIAGGVDGEEEAYAEHLKQSARDLPVRWLGGVSPITAFHAGLDVFVMISEPAGCPNASLEALASGLPVVATDFGGASEQVISGHTGLLVPNRDPAALAAALIRIATDPALRRHCAGNARSHVAENFTLSLMAGRYSELVRGSVASGGAH